VDNVGKRPHGSWVGGNPAVLLDIQRQPGANIIRTPTREGAASQASAALRRP